MDYVKIEAWRQACAALAKAKEDEMRLRRSIIEESFDTSTEGTQNLSLDGGWTLTAKQPFTRSLDQKMAAIVYERVKELNPSLIKLKYELSVGEYRALDDATRVGIDAILTTKPGTASLELTPPKY